MRGEDIRVGRRYRLKGTTARKLLWRGEITVVARSATNDAVTAVIDGLSPPNRAIVPVCDIEPIDDLTELELLRKVADDIAATRKAIENLDRRSRGHDWRTGPL